MDRWTPVLVVLTLILTVCNAEYANVKADQVQLSSLINQQSI